MIPIILSIITIISYTLAVCLKNREIPYSISATFYTLQHKFWFAICMIATSIFLFFPALDISTENTQFLVFLSCIGLFGVGLAPDFKDKWINKIHCTSATITILCSQIWVLLSSTWWILIPIWFIYITNTIVGITKSKNQKVIDRFISTKPMFWCEIAALVCTYATVILQKWGIY